MATLEIIGAPQSNFVRTTRIACMEKGVPYTLIPARPHTPEVDAIHPFGKIPVMRHGDVTLCESTGICVYIDRTFDGPLLIPRDATSAARAVQWISLHNTAIDPLWVRQYLRAYFFSGLPDHPESFDEEELRSCDSMIGTSIRYGSQHLPPERWRQLREIVRHHLLQAGFRVVTKEYGLSWTP